MTNPNVQNAEEESGNPAFGGQDPPAHVSQQEQDQTFKVDPIADASKGEDVDPPTDTDKGITG